MTDVDDIDLRQLVAYRLANTHPDVLRELLSTFIHTLMGLRLMHCEGGLQRAQR